MPPEAVVSLLTVIFPAAIANKGFRKAHRKINRPRPGPTAGLAIAGDQCVVHDPDIRPDILVVVVVDACHQVQDDMRLVAGGEGILVKAYPRGRREFGPDIIVFEFYLVVIGFGRFRGMAESAAVTAPGLAGNAGIEPQFAHGGHDQEIAEIGMPRAAEMRMTKTYDGLVVILIACAILIDIGIVFAILFIGDRIRIRTELHRPKWGSR